MKRKGRKAAGRGGRCLTERGVNDRSQTFEGDWEGNRSGKKKGKKTRQKMKKRDPRPRASPTRKIADPEKRLVKTKKKGQATITCKKKQSKQQLRVKEGEGAPMGKNGKVAGVHLFLRGKRRDGMGLGTARRSIEEED